MNQYESYKAIDLPWLEKIPSHWAILRNKNVFTEMKAEVGEESSEYTLLSLTLNGIIPRDVESGKGKFPEKFDKYKIVEPGNMAFCLFDIDETPRTVGLSPYAGMLTGAYTIMKVDNINSRWVYYYYLSLDNVKAMRPLYSGLRKTINVNTFQGTKLPVPPRSEQDQIVRYLDWQVSKINKLIAAKKKEIALIEEQFVALLYFVITHGLKENLLIKKTNHRWIRTLPNHWKIVAIRRCYKSVLGKMLAGVQQSPDDTMEAYFCAKDVHFNFANKNQLKKMWFSPTEKAIYEVKNGDLLVVEGGAGAGGAAIAQISDDDKIYIQNSIHLLRANSDMATNEFLCYWLYCLQKLGYIGYACSIATIPHFTKEKVLATEMPLPPVDEQKEIVEYLDGVYTSKNKLVESCNVEINSLNELKNKLISDVVTGQIDVRGIEVPDFEYVENIDESFDDEDSEEMSDDEEV